MKTGEEPVIEKIFERLKKEYGLRRRYTHLNYGDIMFETERLRIRNFKEEDAGNCFESWGRDISLGRYIRPYPMSDVSQMNGLVGFLAKNENAWILEEKSTGSVIGYITIDIQYDFLKIGEIGYVIAEKFQRCGYATEALSCLIKIYLYEKDLYLLEAKYNENNLASSKLLNKLGFLYHSVRFPVAKCKNFVV